MGELYLLNFASGKRYIGVTRKTADKRYAEHARAAKRSQKGIVYAAWRKHGAPELVVLDCVPDADLPVAEVEAIAAYGTLNPGGYNITPGGDIPPSLTPSVADKIRQKLKGRKLSPERCLALVDAVRGRKHSPEAIARMRAAQKGKVFSEETRAKMSAAKRGTKMSPEVRAKMSEAQCRRRRAEGFAPQKPRINYPRAST